MRASKLPEAMFAPAIFIYTGQPVRELKIREILEMRNDRMNILVFGLLAMLLIPASVRAGFDDFINERQQRFGSRRPPATQAIRTTQNTGNYYPSRTRSASVRPSIGSALKLTESCWIDEDLDWKGSDIVFASSKGIDFTGLRVNERVIL